MAGKKLLEARTTLPSIPRSKRLSAYMLLKRHLLESERQTGRSPTGYSVSQGPTAIVEEELFNALSIIAEARDTECVKLLAEVAENSSNKILKQRAQEALSISSDVVSGPESSE